MIQDATYQELFAIRHDIMRLSQAHASFAYLNRQKIKTFFSANEIRLQLMDQKLKAIYDEHVQKDEKGVYMQTDDKKDWVYKSELDKINFVKRFESLMQTQIAIHS